MCVYGVGAKLSMTAKGIRIMEKTGTSLMLDSATSSQRLCHDTQELVDYTERVCRCLCLSLFLGFSISIFDGLFVKIDDSPVLLLFLFVCVFVEQEVCSELSGFLLSVR